MIINVLYMVSGAPDTITKGYWQQDYNYTINAFSEVVSYTLPLLV